MAAGQPRRTWMKTPSIEVSLWKPQLRACGSEKAASQVHLAFTATCARCRLIRLMALIDNMQGIHEGQSNWHADPGMRMRDRTCVRSEPQAIPKEAAILMQREGTRFEGSGAGQEESRICCLKWTNDRVADYRRGEDGQNGSGHPDEGIGPALQSKAEESGRSCQKEDRYPRREEKAANNLTNCEHIVPR